MGRRILILGAGVCGLATAIRLLERDSSLDVLLLEQEAEPGGLARSLTLEGHVADLGPHRIFTELPDVQQFLQSIAGPDLETVERRSQMWLRKRWIDYPPRPLEILRVLGPGTLAAALGGFAMEKLRTVFGHRPKQENFETVMCEAFGSSLYRLIVESYTRKVWKMEPAQLHADIARVRVSAGGMHKLIKRVFVPEKPGQETALRKFFYIPGGVEQLVARLEARARELGARIQTQSRVSAIESLPEGRWRVTAATGGGEEKIEADRVVSTLPITDVLLRLLHPAPPAEVRQPIGELGFIANFLVAVLIRRPRVTGNQWLYFPGTDTIFNRGYEPANFSSSLDPADGKSLIVLEVTCHRDDVTWRMSDDALRAEVHRGLQAVGLATEDEIAASRVFRLEHVYPIYDLAYRERLAHAWRYLAGLPGFLSVGRQGLFLHNNMDHSIHMGFRAADLIATEAQPESIFYEDVRRFQQFRIVD